MSWFQKDDTTAHTAECFHGTYFHSLGTFLDQHIRLSMWEYLELMLNHYSRTENLHYGQN